MSEKNLLIRDTQHLLNALNAGEELALVDAREEVPFAGGHPLFAVNISVSKLDIEILNRIPRLNTPVTLYDNGEGLARVAAERLREIGYTDVALLAGGLAGWVEGGGELFSGVNSPANGFASLVDNSTATPLLGTEQLALQLESQDNGARLSAVEARTLADRAGVQRITLAGLQQWQQQERTLYLFDVRVLAEYQQGHLPGSRSVPAAQLVKETDQFASVLNARIVLIDDGDGVRAAVAASWLAQQGWQVAIVDGLQAADFSVSGGWSPKVPELDAQPQVTPAELTARLAEGDTQVLDFTTSANYVNAHIPGAAWLQRSALTTAGADALPAAERYVVTCGSSLLAAYSAEQLRQLTGKEVQVLTGGNTAWKAAGLPVEQGETTLLLPRIDRFLRPEERSNPSAAEIALQDAWRQGLPAQLARDGSHRFKVLAA